MSTPIHITDDPGEWNIETCRALIHLIASRMLLPSDAGRREIMNRINLLTCRGSIRMIPARGRIRTRKRS